VDITIGHRVYDIDLSLGCLSLRHLVLLFKTGVDTLFNVVGILPKPLEPRLINSSSNPRRQLSHYGDERVTLELFLVTSSKFPVSLRLCFQPLTMQTDIQPWGDE